MSPNMWNLIFNMVVNFFEFIIIYYLCINIIRGNKELPIKIVILGLIYGTMLGLLSIQFYIYTFKIIVTCAILSIIKIITHKKIHDMLIIYPIIFIYNIMVSLFVIFLVDKLRLDGQLGSIIGVLISSIIILFSSVRIPLYKLFQTIKKELLLQLFFYISVGIYLIIFSYMNFDYIYIREYIFYFSIWIFITLIGLYKTLKRIFFYTNEVPVQLHDTKNILFGIGLMLQGTTDLDEVRKSYKKCLDIMMMEDIYLESISIDDNNKILSFVEFKREKSTADLETDISYYEPNNKVPFPVIIYMLGVLLDNAIETGTNDPIYIKMRVGESYVEISVSNQYERKGKDDFNEMFQQGISEKSEQGRGYGLSNFKKTVLNYNGEILLEYKYNDKQEKDYVTIIIEVKN